MPESFLLFFVCMFLGGLGFAIVVGLFCSSCGLGWWVFCASFLWNAGIILCVFLCVCLGETRLRHCCGAVLLFLWIGMMGVLCFFTVKCGFVSLFLPPTGCVLFSFKSVGGCVERGLLGACWGQVCILAALWCEADLSHLEGFVFSSLHQFAFAGTFIVDTA